VRGTRTAPHAAFLRTPRGTFTTINVLGATETLARGINAAGQIVGSFRDARHTALGYLSR